MKKLLIIFALFSLASGIPEKEYKVATKSYFEIQGTSNLHDWTMESREAKGDGVISFQDGEVAGIDRLNISLPTESLKSGKRGLDKSAYSALKTDTYPEVKFNLVGVERLKSSGKGTQIKSKGKLTIAGHTRTEELVVFCQTNEQGKLIFEGSKTIKMSDYQVEPPTLILGAIKAGDEIKVSFKIQFNREDNI